MKDVENIAALPVEAAEAEQLLHDNANLLQVSPRSACLELPAAVSFRSPALCLLALLTQVYEMLASLEGTSMKAQQALESGTSVNLREATNLNAYFQKVLGDAGRAAKWPAPRLQASVRLPSSIPPAQVRVTAGKLEERLWSTIRNFLEIAQDDPGLLVTAVQVVELQELVDAQLVAAGQGSSPLRKAWRRRCLAQISMCIQDSFAPLLQRCSQLIAAGENTDRCVTEILAEADEWVAQVIAPLPTGLLPAPHVCFSHPSTHMRSASALPAGLALRSWLPSMTALHPASHPTTASSASFVPSTTASSAA